ncbi:methyltransferase domain-containing protein [Asanoa sp. NPDC049573]|uniref:class I SAM-dependent methyltransferase n=1 Tax=Asanoa sp. NPDC049573 TaxID=3155396 RepID=UPI00344164A3
MNDGHARLCSSRRWAEFIAGEVVPSALDGRDVGHRLLEIGPGYGASTARLAVLGGQLTAVEIDPGLAARLRRRLPDIAVVEGRGEDLPFPDGTFTAVLSFTMLHHVHSAPDQDALFRHARRVLRSGGVFAGSDSIASSGLREFHHDDIYTPVDPHGLRDRLTAAGFTDIRVDIQPEDEWFSFSAVRA